MKQYSIAVLPGDGIGPEVIAEAERTLEAVGDRFGIGFALRRFPIGAAGVAAAGDPFPAETRAAVARADAVLLGAVGDPSLDQAPRHLRPESGLLALRAQLGVYANLRPVTVFPALVDRSPLKADRLEGVDVLIVRELTGGLYYGEPRGREGAAAVNTLRYTAAEIKRVARVAFESARQRRRHVTSVDKANVLEVSQLWRETVTRVGQDYPDVRLDHLYVDTAAMRLISDATTFDVLLTENMFGDILSDEAAVLVGSLGLLPSASLGEARVCSSRSTDLRRTSPAAILPTRSARSPRWPCCCATGSAWRSPPPQWSVPSCSHWSRVRGLGTSPSPEHPRSEPARWERGS